MLKRRWLRAFPIVALIWLTLAASNARAQTISVPALTNVGSGLQGAANTAVLSTAQHGGKTVHVESDNPSVVLVAPNISTTGAASFDVFVPNGSSSVSFVIQGMESTTGTATVTVSAPGFTSGSRTATIVQPAVAISNLITTLDTLDPADAFWVQIGLPSGGNGFVSTTQPVRVGGTGLTATIVNSNALAGQLITTPVTGQSVTVSIPPGFSFSPTSVAAGGVAFDGLNVASTTVSASIPGFIATTAASANVSVTQPVITLGAIGNVGSGLQGSANGVGLSASEHGGVTVHVESGNPSVALVSPNGSTVGTASIDIFLANGFTGASFVVSGLEGATGVSLITVSAPGFGSVSQTVSIQQPALAISNLVTTLDTLDPPDGFWVVIGLPSGGNTGVNPTQSIRAGGVPVTGTIKNSAIAIGDLITTPLTGDSVVVTIPVGSYFSPVSVATGGVALDGTALGSTLVFATIPGFIPTTASFQTVNVTQPIISVSALGAVGSGLQGQANSASLSASQHGGVTVHVASANPSVALVAPTPTTVGSASFDVFLANGSTVVTFYVSGMENVTGTSLITASAPGFTSASQTATIVQPALDITNLVTTLDTLAPSDVFFVRIGLPSGGTSVNPPQTIRAGGVSVTATIKNSAIAIGDLVTAPLTGDSVIVTIPVGSSFSPSTVATGGVAFDGTALGSTTVSATIPGFIATTAASQNVTVTQPTISLSPLGTIGAGLQGAGSSATLSVSQHGGVTVHVESASPSIARVAPNATTTGSASFDVFLANGSTSVPLYVSGMENVTGTSLITVSAPGFISVSQTATIATPALDIVGLTSAMSATDPDDPFQVRVGLPAGGNGSVNPAQVVRAGSPGVTATITLTDAIAGQLVTTLATHDTVTVNIAAGASLSGATVAAGGVAFDPLAPGTTLVAATIPGFTPMGAATQQVVVSQRIITMSAIEDVGAGLQSGVIHAVLGLAQHGGVTVHVASSDPSIALLAPNSSTPGTASLDFPLSNGSTQVSFYVQGVATGTCDITVSAPTFTGTTQPAVIVTPAFDLVEIASAMDAADPNDPFQVRVGLPSGGNGSVNPAQAVRAGSPGLTATITLTNAIAGQLVTTLATNDTVTVNIAAGASLSGATVAAGGVAFDPLAPGTTLVAATIPGFTPTGAATQQVTVSQLIVAMGAIEDVGAGLQSGAISAVLGLAQHGGVTVHVESATPSVALVAPTPTTAGSTSFDVFLADGSTSFTFYVSGMENVTGTSLITVSAPGFISATQPAVIVTPALDLVELASAMEATDPDDPFQVRVGLPGGGNASVNPAQAVRAGSPGLTATITLTDATPGQLVTTLANNDTVTVTITAGVSSSGATVATGGVAFDPLAIGATQVSATIPGFTSTGAATQQVSVSQPIVAMGVIEDVGAGLQSGVLDVVLGLAQHGGVTVHVASSDPSVALLAPNFSTPGTASLDFPLSNGSTQVSFYVQGVAIGTANITASVPTFTSAVRVANIVQSALQVALLPDSIMDVDPNDPFVVRVGVPSGDQSTVDVAQFVRAGGPALSATVSSSDASIAALLTNAENGSPVVVTIPAGENQSGASAVLGGVELDPLLHGATTISAVIPGFISTAAASHLVVVMGSPTGVAAVPLTPGLAQNIPNPFNPITTIRYEIPAGGADVDMSIYDVTGRHVRTLLDENRPAGVFSVQWNGEDDRGQRVASGVYFYRMRAGAFVETRKMVLLK